MPVDLPPAPEVGAPVDQTASPEVLRFLAGRRSNSAVTLAEPAPSADELQILLHLAARVPDHGKLAPWRFIILQGADKANGPIRNASTTVTMHLLSLLPYYLLLLCLTKAAAFLVSLRSRATPRGALRD